MSTTQQTGCVLYKPKQGTLWGNYAIDTTIQELLELIKKNNQYFLVIAAILEQYKNPDDDDETKKIRNADLINIADRYPNTKESKGDTEELISLLDRLYSLSSQDIGDIRGKVLEAVIYHYGPRNFPVSEDTIRCLEAVIAYETETNVLGGNGCDFDFTYHRDCGKIGSIPDYFECKATIDGMVKIGQSMSLLKPQKLNKWQYAKAIYEGLNSQANIQPNIYFACFNSKTEDIQQHINNEGYNCVKILNNKDIFNMLT
ncbi:hypothetical protein PDQ04_16060 [Bacillus cereus]|nr:hypothetical protein [Bacillus cereus]